MFVKEGLDVFILIALIWDLSKFPAQESKKNNHKTLKRNKPLQVLYHFKFIADEEPVSFI